MIFKIINELMKLTITNSMTITEYHLERIINTYKHVHKINNNVDTKANENNEDD